MRSLFLLLGLLFSIGCAADARQPYAFGVLNQRSLQLTAAYWNPILIYVSAHSGVPLQLRIGRTANETTDLIVKGGIDFAYTNHLFTPARAALGWRVLARQDSAGIRGQIVVLDRSKLTRLDQLQGLSVAFANPYAFAGYYLPMDALLRAGVKVKPVFTGNQEAAMGQLLTGQVAAAGVSSQIVADYALRERFAYRVLAQSTPYFDLAVMASPRVSAADGEAVRQAFIAMQTEPKGMRILLQSASYLSLSELRGFVRADDRDYADYRRFFKSTRVPLNE
jgi:ABC-type phosphate/phosphonate transport system, periplasmic component